MEINITNLFHEDLTLFQDSIANSGRSDIGMITWENAKGYTEYHYLNTPEAHKEFIVYAREFGAWSKDDLNEMTDTDRNALLLQMIAADILTYQRQDEDNDPCTVYAHAGQFYFDMSH